LARFYWRHLLRRTREIAQFVQISSDPLQPGNARGMSPKHLAAAPCAGATVAAGSARPCASVELGAWSSVPGCRQWPQWPVAY